MLRMAYIYNYTSMMKNFHKVTIFILLFASFGNITAQNWDIETLHSINSNQNKFLKKYSLTISDYTSTVVYATPIVMGTMALVKWDKELFYSTLTVSSSIVLNQVLTAQSKKIINRPRPYETYPDLIQPYAVMHDKSMPSGHTSTAFNLATSISLEFPKWYVIAPSYFWAASVGYSRMNLGVHYPSDVLTGVVLGAGSAFLTYKISHYLQHNGKNKKMLSLNDNWY